MNSQHQYELKNGLARGLICAALACTLLFVANVATAAKSIDRSEMLFPYYGVTDVLDSAAQHHYAKDTAVLRTQLQKLSTITSKYCKGNGTLGSVKKQYTETYLAWLELSAVVIGPMLENNTVRQIDFRPLRVNLLERAIKKQPQGAQAMALVGSPAKGFPALEYLLTQVRLEPNSSSCSYAQEVIDDIARTVSALQWQQGSAAQSEIEEEDSLALSSGLQLYFNQLVGATHNLAWERMEKPLLKNRDEAADGAAKQWPLSELSLTEKAWVAQWHGIDELLVVKSQTVPLPRTHVIPLEAYLRGLGEIDLADSLVQYANAVDKAVLANTIANPDSIEHAVEASKALKNFLETEVAKDLKVSIQFSSSDGD